MFTADGECRTSSQAWLFHRRRWVGIEEEFFVRGNHSFALVEAGRVVGVHPLYVSDAATGAADETLLHGGIHRHTGLALRDDLSVPLVEAARSAALRRVLAIAAETGAQRIQLNAHNLAPANLGAARAETPYWASAPGFQLGLLFGPLGMTPRPFASTYCADQIVDLSPAENDIFARFEKKSCRSAIHKAEKAGFKLEPAENAHHVARYYKLATLSAARTGEALAPRAYYERLWSDFAAAGRCRIYFACHGGEDAAALILLYDKGAASYLAGCSHPDHLPNRVNDWIHWQAMRRLKSEGAVHYRFGPIFPELPRDWPVAQVSRFKGKWGARAYPIIQGSLFIDAAHYAGPAEIPSAPEPRRPGMAARLRARVGKSK